MTTLTDKQEQNIQLHDWQNGICPRCGKHIETLVIPTIDGDVRKVPINAHQDHQAAMAWMDDFMEYVIENEWNLEAPYDRIYKHAWNIRALTYMKCNMSRGAAAEHHVWHTSARIIKMMNDQPEKFAKNPHAFTARIRILTYAMHKVAYENPDIGDGEFLLNPSYADGENAVNRLYKNAGFLDYGVDSIRRYDIWQNTVERGGTFVAKLRHMLGYSLKNPSQINWSIPRKHLITIPYKFRALKQYNSITDDYKTWDGTIKEFAVKHNMNYIKSIYKKLLKITI